MAISRRDLLKTAAAAVSGPTLLLASKAVTLGGGEHTYEFIGDWARLPSSRQFGYTHGVVIDSQDRIVIHNRSRDAIAIFDRDGKFVKSWGEDFELGAHGLLLNKEGNTEYLYLADPERHLVAKTTLDGERLWVLRYPRESNAYEREEQYKPTNAAVAPNGDIYIADGYGLSWIHQYNSKAEYIRSWGGKGREAGQLDCPHGIWIDTRGPDPVVTVADRSNQRLQRFTLEGKHIGFVNDELRRPCHFDQRNGELLIPDLYGRLTIFDKNNKLITHLGDNPDVWKTKGWPNIPHEIRETGRFVSPHAACWDGQGNIYVVEWVADGRVTKLRQV
jgi:DNA-binding beta-propeller fold protein YncE